MNAKCSKLDFSECGDSRNCEWRGYEEGENEEMEMEMEMETVMDGEEENAEMDENAFLMDIARSHSIQSQQLWNDISTMSLAVILCAFAVVIGLYRWWTTRKVVGGYIKLEEKPVSQ